MTQLEHLYTDDPGVTADELLKQFNDMFMNYTFRGDEFLVLPLSFVKLVEELNQEIESISTRRIYGVPVLIVSDWDVSDWDLVLRNSKHGKELLANYDFSDVPKVAGDG